MNNKLLTKAQTQQVMEDVITSFDTEISRVMVRNQGVGQTLLQTIFEWHYDQPLYTMFTGNCVQHFTNAVFTDNHMRDLFMNICERVSLKWTSEELSYNDLFLSTFAEAICRNKSFNEENAQTTLIDTATRETINANVDVIKKLLTSNMWYFVLYMLLLNLEYSSLFKAITDEKDKTKSNSGAKQ